MATSRQVTVIQTDAGVFSEEGEAVGCHWFAKCTNNAMTTRKHPVLGDVPICTRCDEKVARL